MGEFHLEAVGSMSIRKCPMFSAEKAEKRLKDLWDICLGPPESGWIPSGEFEFRPRRRPPSDPVFRVRDFERGREGGVGGLGGRLKR
jgi:hypothetical protein